MVPALLPVNSSWTGSRNSKGSLQPVALSPKGASLITGPRSSLVKLRPLPSSETATACVSLPRVYGSVQLIGRKETAVCGRISAREDDWTSSCSYIDESWQSLVARRDDSAIEYGDRVVDASLCDEPWIVTFDVGVCDKVFRSSSCRSPSSRYLLRVEVPHMEVPGRSIDIVAWLPYSVVFRIWRSVCLPVGSPVWPLG